MLIFSLIFLPILTLIQPCTFVYTLIPFHVRTPLALPFCIAGLGIRTRCQAASVISMMTHTSNSLRTLHGSYLLATRHQLA